MSTIGIVALSLIGGLFLAILLLSLAISIWAALRLRAEVKKIGEANGAVYAETRVVLQQNAAETKALFESARSSFQALQRETKTIQEANVLSTAKLLDEHGRKMAELIGKINGEAMSQAAAQNIKAVTQLTQLIGILQQAFTDQEQRVANTYAPEEYARESETSFPGTPASIYNSVSQTAAFDEQAESQPQGEAAAH